MQSRQYLVYFAKRVRMKYEDFNINNISTIFIKYPALHAIQTPVLNAYRTIFQKAYTFNSDLTPDELTHINTLLKSCLLLISTLPKIEPNNIPQHTICYYTRIAITHWFYKNNKSKNNQIKTPEYIWQINKSSYTSLRRTFKKHFNAMPETLLAGCIFALLPELIKSIHNNDFFVFGSIIADITEINQIIQKQAKYIAGGHIIHTPQNRQNKAISKILKDKHYEIIKNKPHDEQILYIQEHCFLSENDSEHVLSVLKTLNKI